MASSSSSFSFSVAIFSFIFLFSLAAANEVTVGGKSGEWTIPPSSSSFTGWVQKARFKVGDFIVFPYKAGKDSVFQVTKQAYNSCNTTNPLANYTDGETKVKLDRPGPFYFISGTKGHCEKGQKLSLVVVTPRNITISPAPSPIEFEDGPALAPAMTGGSVRFGGGYVLLGIVTGLGAWF